MKNLILKNKMKALVAAFAVLFITAFVAMLSTRTNAIPYNGEDTQPSPVPAFNVYTGVPSEGNESDFFKGKVAGSTEASVNNVVNTCETGTQFQLRAYIHNGASQYENGNGNGPSVAHDTRISVALPGNEASEFAPNATVSSSNAGSISDSMTITCSDGRTVTLSYVPGTAEQYSPLSGVNPVSDSIVTPAGAPIGTQGADGNVWGCWDQRVWVKLIVVVTEVEPELHPAVCDALLATLLTSNQLRTDDVEYTANDAVVNTITVDYGDGNSETVNPDAFPLSHTYESAGTYLVKATLNTTFNGQPSNVTGPNCEKKFTSENPEIPTYACEMFELSINDRKATVSFLPVATGGAEFKDASIKYIADGVEQELVTTDVLNAEGKVVSMYTFNAEAKNVDTDATVRFTVPSGDDKTVESVDCGGEAVLGSVTPTPTPKPTGGEPATLPNTGAGSIAGIFVAVTAAGAALHRKFTLSNK